MAPALDGQVSLGNIELKVKQGSLCQASLRAFNMPEFIVNVQEGYIICRWLNLIAHKSIFSVKV